MSAAQDEPEWEPGIPLHDRSDHPHSLYLFNFREVPAEGENYAWADAADWPAQRKKPLPPECGVEKFIQEHRASLEEGAA